MGREKQQAVTLGSPKGGKAGSKVPKLRNGKNRAQEPAPPASPPGRTAGRRVGGSQVSSAAQDAMDEARVMAEGEEEVGATPSVTPPPLPRGAGGLTDRQKKAAEEQKARNEAKVIADLNAKLAAANAQLKLAMENDKKRKESSSGESANPRKRKMSNASTRRKQVPIFRCNYFSGCHFFDGLYVHRQSWILVTLIMPIL